MVWNPKTYNKFKSDRAAPFYDLLALLEIKEGIDVIDLGCGTGELTAKLSEALPGARVVGIDSSAEMLKDAAAFSNERLTFTQRNIEAQLATDEQWDLVFSNAAIQWVSDHETLLPRIISRIRKSGQLLIQVPAQHHNAANQILAQLSKQQPFHSLLSEWQRPSSVLDADRYAAIFFENGSSSMTVYEKIYPLILKDADAIYDFVSGTALIPYLEHLDEKHQADFITAFKESLAERFPGSPVFYPFRRLILEAKF